MTELRTLQEVVDGLSALPADHTIYARHPWSCDSVAIVVEEDAGGGRAEADGYRYLLEVDLAVEVLEVWTAWRHGATPTAEDRCRAVLHYAENDTYLPVEADRAWPDAL